ncbi:MAG: hypothetical protein H6810_06785 [Phycisphaeraceae bacterium]|nr:MAG: hypothetical protein H6810_06785 [Phycisphaeraceae bacterium]
MVLYSAADLLWATRIKSTADAMGVPCRPARTAAMLRARLGDSEVRAVLLDLDAPEQAWELLAVLRGPDAGERENSIRVIAWGPHVAVDLFAKARELGADEVLTRGAFASALPDLLVRLGTG